MLSISTKAIYSVSQNYPNTPKNGSPISDSIGGQNTPSSESDTPKSPDAGMSLFGDWGTFEADKVNYTKLKEEPSSQFSSPEKQFPSCCILLPKQNSEAADKLSRTINFADEGSIGGGQGGVKFGTTDNGLAVGPLSRTVQPGAKCHGFFES